MLLTEVKMKIDHVVSLEMATKPLRWVDIENPEPHELRAIALQYDLPSQAVQDCLEPEHFPKFESFGALNFMIVRVYDVNATQDADTVQELTRKIAVFESESLVITIHRTAQVQLSEIKDQWRERMANGESLEAHHILLSILTGAIQSYQKPMVANRNLLEDFEVNVFKHDGDTFEDGYFLKRRASAFKRMLRMTIDILPRIAGQYKDHVSLVQDARENGERLYAYSEEFHENITSLVGLQLALSNHRLTVASFKTNEVMRILTVFSVFFMPLNLITGIYGMNFEHMPELKWPHGYYIALCVMLAMTVVILTYFKRKGVLDAPGVESSPKV
jgi:magnesium transporter